ncbi:MAG: DUF3798 domain-containing protein [Deltaproteobacteria bacterium]|jgi:hypothetical protein|nr:DUF3798 domain-containing protein [Deltaproteobacteria bacterium]
MGNDRSRLARLILPAVALAGLAAVAVAYLLSGEATVESVPNAPQGPGHFVVAVAVGPREVFPEENLAVDRLIERYGEEGLGGVIRRVRLPDGFETDREGAAAAILSQKSDLDVRALLAVPAFRGSLDVFAQLKKARPDMLLLAYDSREDPGPMSMYSDLTVDPDFVLRGWFLAKSASELGAKTALYVSASRDLESPKARRMLAVFREAAPEFAIELVEIDAGPGLGEGSVGAAARASAWVEERCAAWTGKYGQKTLFYSPSGPLAQALLACAAKGGGMFLESPRPSPYLLFPEILGLPEDGGAAARGLAPGGFVELLNDRASQLSMGGRLGVWPVSFGGEVVEAMGGLAVKSASGGATVSEQGFMGTLLAGSPEGRWTRRDLTDAATGRRIKKQVMLSSDIDVLGGGVFRSEEAEAPVRFRSVQPPPVPGDEAPFLIGFLTGTESQGGDDFLGAREFERLHGKAGEGGMVRLATYDADRFLEEMPKTVELLSELASDPLMKVIVANQAVPGTAEGFRRIKEFRQDILLFAMEPHEDPGVIAAAADLAVMQDFLESGYLIVKAAKDMGASKFVHISFPRHLAFETMAIRRAVMREAASDLGLEFFDAEAPDPLDPGVGSELAKAWIEEVFPGWLALYGERTAFFATNDAETEALIKVVAERGGLFVQQDVPSPIMGYSGAFELNPQGYGYRWEDYIRDLEAKAAEVGASGRLGTWVYPLGYCESAGAAEYGRRIAMGEVAPGEIQALLDSFSKFSGGASWTGSFLADSASGKPVRNFFQVYQDTYVLGLGYLGLTSVEVPMKYRLLVAGGVPEEPPTQAPPSAAVPGGTAGPAGTGGPEGPAEAAGDEGPDGAAGQAVHSGPAAPGTPGAGGEGAGPAPGTAPSAPAGAAE